jgi:thiosulfate dehydrogenase
MNETSIRRRAKGFLGGATCLLLAALVVGCSQQGPAPAPVGLAAAQTPSQPAPDEATAEPAAADETIELTSCDGENTVAVSEDLTGQPLADALMDQWTRDHPEANWVAEEKAKHAFNPPADNSDLLKGDQGEGHAYGNYTELDLLTWAREAEKFVAEGSRIFHSADALGSTVAVSCDMCHPHAANTHPETYPKFQTQLGRVALLRDMIDWCVEHPVRGEHLDPDGPTMRALEAYILAQRKGVEMNYGKH